MHEGEVFTVKGLSSLFVILASALALSACGTARFAVPADMDGYPYHHADFDYRFAWKTVVTDRGLVIDGMLRNVRYAYIDSVLVTAAVVGTEGTVVARDSTFPMPQFSIQGDVSRFSLLLAGTRPVHGDKIRFQIHYTGNEGGNHTGVDWHSSFTTDAVSGDAVRPPTGDRNIR